MANPIALLAFALGGLLLILGLVLIAKQVRVAGILISLLGLGLGALPFGITLLLGSNP